MENYGKFRKNVPQQSNSMNKFVRELSQKRKDGEFLKEQEIITSANNQFPNLAKLSLKRHAALKLAPIFTKENYLHTPEKQRKCTTSSRQLGVVEYLPVPVVRKSQPSVGSSQVKPAVNKTLDGKLRFGRDLVVITGSVQHVLKTFKSYPNVRALYEVYGNLKKIHKGKIRLEHIILMRDESGPVLQGFYFDFTNCLDKFFTASPIRCIGQFNTQNRFHIHKIEKLASLPPETVLSRIQNVCNFTLLQAQEDQPK